MKSETILICGGSIVGLATALGLARAGLKAVLLGPKKALEPVVADRFHPRVYALSPASRRFLTELGVWGLMDEARITLVEAMEVYGDASGKVSLNAWQAAQPAMAWIVESSELERALRQAVQVLGIAWHTERFQALAPGGALTDTGRELPAVLVVGADGAPSAVRAAADIAFTSAAYGDTGVVTHLACEQPHLHTARQWFTNDGVVALLPMPDTADGPQVSLVWSMPAPLANELMALPGEERDASLRVRLQSVTGGVLGSLTVRSPVLGFPLFLEQSDMVAPGVALVGDAAHRVHPLAGQGLNLGLGDAQQLIEILRTRPDYRRMGDLALLRSYRRRRAEHVAAMGLATDGLHRLFALRSTPAVMLRNAGMHMVDRLPFIKRRLIQSAS